MRRYLLVFVLVLTYCAAEPLGVSIFAKAELNPYKNAPLSAIVRINADDVKDIKVSIKPKNKGAAISYNVSAQSVLEYGGVPIIGLYENYLNSVSISAKYCPQEICENVTYDFTIQTPKILPDATLLSKNSGIFNPSRLVLINAQNSSYAFDSFGQLRFALVSISSPNIIQANNNELLILKQNILQKVDLLGRVHFSLQLLNPASNFAQDSLNNLHFSLPYCNELGCEQTISSFYSDARAYKMIFLQNLIKYRSNILKALDHAQVCKLNEVEDWAKLGHISSMAADNDGLILALPNQSMIIKLNSNFKLAWIFSSSDGLDKNMIRKSLRVINANLNRLDCNIRNCKDLDTGFVFSYPSYVTSLKVLGHKNGNLILGLYETAEAKDALPRILNDPLRAYARVFEIDERRLNIKEIWRSKYQISTEASSAALHNLSQASGEFEPSGSISGSLRFIDVLSENDYYCYAYSPDEINIDQDYESSIDFSADFSKQRPKALASKELLHMRINGIKALSVFRLSLPN